MRPSLRLASLFVLLAVLLAACESDESREKASAGESATVAEQAGPNGPRAPGDGKPRTARLDDELSPQEAVNGFHPQAFPPVIPDTKWHADAWMRNDCLRCHETGVADAPEVVHQGMPEVLLQAKCRTCHVQVKGAPSRGVRVPASDFAPNAFPPMIPASEYHVQAWMKDDCLLCHETGSMGATPMIHAGLPAILKQAKCRTCHPQVRVWDASLPAR